VSDFPPVSASFFAQDTVSLAKNLLGCYLVRELGGHLLGGVICETEAYLQDDPAAHTFRGQTPRNLAMFGPAGHAYVYRSYGIHWCMNVVGNQPGIGEGILIRALIPEIGVEYMQHNRQGAPLTRLTNGPGNLCQALGITIEFNNHDLTTPPLYLSPAKNPVNPDLLRITPRIGISQAVDAPLRFVLTDKSSSTYH
jgi:DNA-3-methyladenine glycosylase